MIDKREIKFKDFANKKYLDDVLTDIKFSNVAWNDDKGVFYKKNSNKSSLQKILPINYTIIKLEIFKVKTNWFFDTSNTKSNFSFYQTK